MRSKITKPDGTIIEIKGTPSEIRQVIEEQPLFLGPQTNPPTVVPMIPWPPVTPEPYQIIGDGYWMGSSPMPSNTNSGDKTCTVSALQP